MFSGVVSGLVANSVAMIFSFPDMEMADGTCTGCI